MWFSTKQEMTAVTEGGNPDMIKNPKQQTLEALSEQENMNPQEFTEHLQKPQSQTVAEAKAI